MVSFFLACTQHANQEEAIKRLDKPINLLLHLYVCQKDNGSIKCSRWTVGRLNCVCECSECFRNKMLLY